MSRVSTWSGFGRQGLFVERRGFEWPLGHDLRVDAEVGARARVPWVDGEHLLKVRPRALGVAFGPGERAERHPGLDVASVALRRVGEGFERESRGAGLQGGEPALVGDDGAPNALGCCVERIMCCLEPPADVSYEARAEQ